MKLIGKTGSFWTLNPINWRRRKIKEALFIDCLNPQKEVTNSIMNLEKGLEISECWKEFNQDIRKVLFKIIPIKK